ncbi:capsid cement protein [Verrucomicrobium spinosum]|uniref:capsid cement protein n=1 Tax=Verrucomicrobium spinosum TaxID=2736 RepID=UPI000310F8A3|nr:capsid cement protein [Verrucomicrobium spinosum]
MKQLLVAVATAVVTAGDRLFGGRPRHGVAMANTYEEAVGTHHSAVDRKAEAAITTRHLLYKKGTADNQVSACGAAEIPLGTVDNIVDIDERVSVLLLGKGSTKKMVASEAITVGEQVFTAAAGKVQDLPAGAGTYYGVGTALTAAGADGDLIEVQDCVPVKLVVT